MDHASRRDTLRALIDRSDLHTVAQSRGPSSSVVRESCYRFYKPPTRSFLWLQPRSPVVAVVLENGRGPDPPDARAGAAKAALGSGRPVVAGEAPGNHPAGNHRGVAPAKVAGASLRRGKRAAVLRDANQAAGKAVEEKAAEEKVQDVNAPAAVAVLVVERSLPWLG
jgi:hypothetical protein